MAEIPFVKACDEQAFYDQGRDWETDQRLRLLTSEIGRAHV